MNWGQGFVFIISQCSYLWGILQHFRAIRDSLFRGHIFYSLNDKSIFSDTIKNMTWKYFPLVMMCNFQIQAKLSSHWPGWRPDKAVSTGSLNGKSSSAQRPLHQPLLGSLSNYLKILGLTASHVILENLFTSLYLIFHACQNGDTIVGLTKFATRNNQMEIFPWALGTIQILHNDKDTNNDPAASNFIVAFKIFVLFHFIYIFTFYFEII